MSFIVVFVTYLITYWLCLDSVADVSVRQHHVRQVDPTQGVLQEYQHNEFFCLRPFIVIFYYENKVWKWGTYIECKSAEHAHMINAK